MGWNAKKRLGRSWGAVGKYGVGFKCYFDICYIYNICYIYVDKVRKWPGFQQWPKDAFRLIFLLPFSPKMLATAS